MSAAQTDANRPIEVPEGMKNSAIKEFDLVGRNTLAHVAEDDAGYLLQQSGVPEMKEHTVPLIGFRADVFKEENTVAVNAGA